MNEITEAIEARQTQIAHLQNDIDTLRRAASIMGAQATVTAKATRQKATAQPKPTTKPQPKTTPQPKQKRRLWSAAEKKAIGKRMKAYWAKRRKAKG